MKKNRFLIILFSMLMTFHLILLVIFSIMNKPDLGKNAPHFLVFIIPLYLISIALTALPNLFRRNTNEPFNNIGKEMLEIIKHIIVIISLLFIWVLSIIGFMESVKGIQIFLIWGLGFGMLFMNVVLFFIEIIALIKKDKKI